MRLKMLENQQGPRFLGHFSKSFLWDRQNVVPVIHGADNVLSSAAETESRMLTHLSPSNRTSSGVTTNSCFQSKAYIRYISQVYQSSGIRYINIVILMMNLLRLMFDHATRMHSTDNAVARCLSVCLSVCPSVTRRYSVETAKHIIVFLANRLSI